MTQNIDPAALAAARERLEYHLDARAESAAGGGPKIWSSVLVADLRLVLDALKEAERVADAGKRHFDGQYRPWPQAGGPKDRQCQHGVDRERFDCEGCDAQVLSAWRKQQ
jgi:hypothetical protein